MSKQQTQTKLSQRHHFGTHTLAREETVLHSLRLRQDALETHLQIMTTGSTRALCAQLCSVKIEL